MNEAAAAWQISAALPPACVPGRVNRAEAATPACVPDRPVSAESRKMHYAGRVIKNRRDLSPDPSCGFMSSLDIYALFVTGSI